MTIKNIVFDVGNVLLRWDPKSVVRATFSEVSDCDEVFKGLLRDPTWFALNQGLITEAQAIDEYASRFGVARVRIEQLLFNVKESLQPIPGSIELLHAAAQANFNCFALTDNTHGIMQHLKAKYDFWSIFQGIVVSATVKHLKPSPEIYRYLLTTYQLDPNATVFIDDLPLNVLGARDVGIWSIQFENPTQCLAALRELKVDL